MRTWLLNGFLVSLTLGVCLFAGEMLYRAKEKSLPQTSFYTVDPVRGWALAPGVEGWQTEEGNAYVRISPQGLRDREYKTKKPPRTIRVAVLGDSCTEALQVAAEKTFLAVAEKQLFKDSPLENKSFQLMNFGVKGYGTAQQLLTLREKVWKYQPDIVILAFFSGNDVYNNHPRLNPMMAEHSPYFVIDADSDQLLLQTAFGDTPLLGDSRLWLKQLRVSLSEKSAFLRQIFRRIDRLDEQQTKKRVANWEEELGDEYLNWLTAKPPQLPEMKEAWKITDKLILQIHREVMARDADFLLVSLTTPIQVHPDRAYRKRHLRQYNLPSLDYADNRLTDFARRNNISILTLAKPLRDYAERNNILLHGFRNMAPGQGHWNEHGHQIAGKFIADEIRRRLN